MDDVAEDYVSRLASLDPILATSAGIAGHDHEMPDFSPAGLLAQADLAGDYIAQAVACPALDDVDLVTRAAMTERLGVFQELYESGELSRELNLVSCPLQRVREVFDLMAQETGEDWQLIAHRLQQVPAALEGYSDSLRHAASQGQIAARRQVLAGIDQAENLAGAASFFDELLHQAQQRADRLPGEVLRDLASGVLTARRSYAALSEVLRDELAPQAPLTDAVGRHRYALLSRAFLGTRIDLDDTYEWGLAELGAIVAEQQRAAERVAGAGATIEEAMSHLESEPSRRIPGATGPQEWLQQACDEAREAMVGPSFTAGVDTDGLDGRIAALNSWRRQVCRVVGHDEGWQLYAEQAMADLGLLEDPGHYLAMLDAQRLRCARLISDIGLHLGKDAPGWLGDGAWDAAKARHCLRANTALPPPSLRADVERYLGRPGQAPCDKIGQREWQRLRDTAQAASEAQGQEFCLQTFHAEALSIGSLPIDVMHAAMLPTV